VAIPAGLAPDQVVKEVTDLVVTQYNNFKNAIEETKEEIDEKLTKSSVKFQNKPIERQYEVNSEFLAINKKVLKALKHRNTKKAKKLLKDQRKALEDHEQDLLVADSSEYGWLTVAKIRDKKFLSSSLVKKIHQVDSLLAKAKAKNGSSTQGYAKAPVYQSQKPNYGAWQQQNGPWQLQNGQWQQQQNGAWQPRNYGPWAPQNGGVITKRQERKSPEEILHEVAKKTRAGNCSHCDGSGHWYRECPAFWTKVAESRVAWHGQGGGAVKKENEG